MGIKDQEGFISTGNWYKGNLHSHTTNSDGMLTPQQSVQLFKENGYHFLCLSEHDLYTDYREKYNTGDFIILPGVEASAVLYEQEGCGDRLKVHHIHGILGTKEMQKEAEKPLFKHKEVLEIPKYYGQWNGEQTAQELTDMLRARGCIAIYNHPVWSRVTEAEFIHTRGILALEIYNYNTVNESGTGYDTTHWDTMLRAGRQIYAVASDDNHNEGIFDDACGGYIMVNAPELTHDAVIQGLISGNYYSSSGPEIYNWGVKNGVAYVECSEVNRVNFIAGNYLNAGTAVLCDTPEDTMTRAEFKLRGNETYLRIECCDKYGKTAWTNALF